MFTGIVQGVGEVDSIEEFEGHIAIKVSVPAYLTEELKMGASISINGVCLSVTSITPGLVGFDIIRISQVVSNLSDIKCGDRVNVERSMRPGDEVGGHILSGHVDFAAKVLKVRHDLGAFDLVIDLPEQWRPYVFGKGFIGINGASLTVSAINKSEGYFECSIIPETLRSTNIDQLKEGSLVNIEIDRSTQAIVETVRDVLERKLGNIDERFLEGIVSSLDLGVSATPLIKGNHGHSNVLANSASFATDSEV